MMNRPAVISISAIALASAVVSGLYVHEGYVATPYKDSVGVPTIGIGTTVYPDGKKVTMQDAPISRQLAEAYALAHVSKDAALFFKTIEGIPMWEHEAYAGLEFTYQFGMGNWSPNSSMLRKFKAGDYKGACDAFLLYKNAGGKDCSVRSNNCYGVWTRQLKRRQLCLGEISIAEFQKG